MSESRLNKEFSERDIQRMRNIVSGNTAERTRVQAGYQKQSVEHGEGDVWEESGKTWTIKNGIKQTVTKHDKLTNSKKCYRVLKTEHRVKNQIIQGKIDL